MSKRSTAKIKILIPVMVALSVIGLLAWYVHRHTIAVLQPAGEVAQKERNLLVFGVLLSALVVVPVFAMTIVIALKYREGNHTRKKVKYSPEWNHSRLFESLWWGVPFAIIVVLSIVTWNSSHALDPYKPLASNKQALQVQVICLDWKWLFMYPEQHIASVNLLEMPVNTPVDFHITSDAVMNSFWIPQLSGQIYAMPGMDTQLHLMADKTGSFLGSPANIAGVGFARMDFTAKSVSAADFKAWVSLAQSSSNELDQNSYDQLAKPSDNNPVVLYAAVQNGLYNNVIMKYMMPDMPRSNVPGTNPKSPNANMPNMMPGMSM
jgi:cytochrome o ubiquinol oxidase subunit II